VTDPASRRCIVVLGGSFDPVHQGHVALALHFFQLLAPNELRIIPAGQPWQKSALHATAAQRLAMVHCAFDPLSLPIVVDEQEIKRNAPSYTIDTLRALRAEVGPDVCLVLLMGADQWQRLHTWREWERLFDYAHLCAASRPGFAMDASCLSASVAHEFSRRAGTPEQIRATPQGLTYLATGLDVAISATDIRAALQRGAVLATAIPATVLDYIKQHHLYRN